MLQAFLPIISAALEKLVGLIPDPAAREKAKAEAELQVFTAIQSAMNAQIEVNKAEAAAGGYAGGWRPTIGYVCAAALAYQYVLRPLGMWAAAVAGADIPAPPVLDDSLWELVVGMLGMAGLRSFDKRQTPQRDPTLGQGIRWNK